MDLSLPAAPSGVGAPCPLGGSDSPRSRESAASLTRVNYVEAPVTLRRSNMKPILGGSRYANITATLALVVALGGTSYAAVNIPANSVGSKQIINSAVKSADVKNDGL